MKLQLDEILPAQDPDLVLHTLEACLRDVSLSVERSGNELIVFGIGPSHRAKNRNDKATLHICSKQDATVIHTEASFQASALLGDQSQDNVVRSKFEIVFESMRAELRYRSSRNGPRTLMQASFTRPDESTQKLQAKIAAAVQAPDLESRREVPPPDLPSKRRPPLRIIIASLFGLGVLLTPVLHHRYASDFATPWLSSHATESKTASHPTEAPPPMSSNTNKIPKPVVSIPSPAQPGSLASSSTQIRQENASPQQRLQDWEDALRSRDAAAQAAFYSTRVHPYLGNQDVNHNFILHEKQASIQRRQGLWTLKLEHVKVKRETPSTIRVDLVKHIMDQPANSSITERFVRSELHLKLVDGQWFITAERDVP